MTNQELINTYYHLCKMKGYKSFRFNYGIAKNVQLLKKEFEILSELEASINLPLKAYDSARDGLLKKHAKRDEAGEPITKTSYTSEGPKVVYDLNPEKATELLADLKTLKEANTELIEHREEELLKFRESLKEKNAAFVPYTIKMEDVAKDILTEDTVVLLMADILIGELPEK